MKEQLDGWSDENLPKGYKQWVKDSIDYLDYDELEEMKKDF